MKLEKLLHNIKYSVIKGDIDKEVKGLYYDSRKVTDGSCFVCLSGSLVDGHDYIDAATEKGATVIFVERDVLVNGDVTVIKLDSTRKCLSQLAINYFGNPASELVMIGITGTKGKTTTSWMIKNILEEAGYKTGVIGTMGIFIGDKHYETVNTTPESYDVQKYLREMVDSGVKYAIMEVSSQALKVGRVEGLSFDYGVFTNLTRDHIGEGEHENMEDYIYSKSLLFKRCTHGILNIDDSHYDDMIKDATCDIYSFGKNKDASLVIDDIKLVRKEHFIGLELDTKGIIDDKFLVNTPGEFSAYNAAASIMVAKLIGISIDFIKSALVKVAVKGRVEIVPVSSKYTVIIDYAHNGVSMESILNTMRAYNPKRIVSLFGCGGNRSKDRRYDMGEISGRLADFTIVTEDNSRYEDINDIMNDIEIGLKKVNGKYVKIADRRAAIGYAIDNALDGDIILLLGKGHETYREINGVREHLDEREIIRDIMDNKKKGMI